MVWGKIIVVQILMTFLLHETPKVFVSVALKSCCHRTLLPRDPIETPCFWQRRAHVQGFFAGTPFTALPHRQPTRHAYRPAAD